jgi:proteic killer suppression protein
VNTKTIAYLCREQISDMKVEFEKDYLRELYETGKTTDRQHRYQPQVVNGYLKCVKYLMTIVRMEDLYLINSLNYERLKGDKKGLSSVRINDRYRLEFRETVNANDLLKVEICSLIDITNHYK